MLIFSIAFDISVNIPRKSYCYISKFKLGLSGYDNVYLINVALTVDSLYEIKRVNFFASPGTIQSKPPNSLLI